MTTTAMLPDDTDLAALFDIEMSPPEAPVDFATMAASIKKILCGKCNGRGNFVSYTGRIVGKCFTCDGSGLRPTTGSQAGADIKVDAIAQAFAAAYGRGIKRPKLRLDTFVFSRAPDTGRNAGSIYVVEDDVYLGKVTDGRFYASRECTDPTKARVVAVASTPYEAAKAYGMRTGVCCCCRRTLTKGISIDLGIGPICRERFGW